MKMLTKETNDAKINDIVVPTINDMEIKTQKSSAGMEVCQHEAAARTNSNDDSHVFDCRDNQKTMRNFKVIPTSLDAFTINNIRSGVSNKHERKRKSNETELNYVEDIKRREFNRIQAVVKATELSRNRSMFNGNKNTLPSIGKGLPKVMVDSFLDKLLPAKENGITPSPIGQDTISVISKHEARVRTICQIKKISKEFVSTDAKLIEPLHRNTAPEIIEAYEGEIGRPYERYGGYPTGSAILHGSYSKPHCSKSGLMSRTSPTNSYKSPR